MSEIEEHPLQLPTDSPNSVTVPHLIYINDSWGLSAFLIIIFQTSMLVDTMTMAAFKSFQNNTENPPFDPKKLEELGLGDDFISRMSNGGVGAQQAMVIFERLIAEMALCRAVDAYLHYISSVLTLIFRTADNFFKKSSDKIEIRTVFAYQNMDELLAAIIEKHVHDLAYKGLRELSDDISNKHGFKLFEKAGEEKNRAIRIVAMRNLIVHNRGIINDQFLSQVPNFPAKIGERLPISMQSVQDDMQFLILSVLDIDKRAISKFGLPTIEKANQENNKVDG